MPTIDLYEEKDSIIVKADIPGLTKEEIGLTVWGDLVTIKGEKKKEEEVKEKDYYRRERVVWVVCVDCSAPLRGQGGRY